MDEDNNSDDHSDSQESISSDDSNPGRRQIWFGRHAGTRLEDLYEGYKAWACHPQQKKFRWYDEFKQLCDEYRKWREAHLKRKEINPGNVIVWFGEYKLHPFSRIYDTRGYLDFILQDRFEGHSWYYWVKDHAERLTEWREEHPAPESQTGTRGPNSNVRDIGEKLTRWHERAPVQDEYVYDDFLVPDDEFENEADTFDDADFLPEEKVPTVEEEAEDLRLYNEAINADASANDAQDDGSDHDSLPDSQDGSDDDKTRDLQFEDADTQKALKQSALARLKKQKSKRSASNHSASSVSVSALSPRKHAMPLSSDEEEPTARPSRVRRRTAQQKSLLDSDSEEELPMRLTRPGSSSSEVPGPRRSARLNGGRTNG